MTVEFQILRFNAASQWEVYAQDSIAPGQEKTVGSKDRSVFKVSGVENGARISFPTHPASLNNTLKVNDVASHEFTIYELENKKVSERIWNGTVVVIKYKAIVASSSNGFPIKFEAAAPVAAAAAAAQTKQEENKQ